MSLRFWNKTVAFPLSACWADPPDVVAEATRGASKGARLPHARQGRNRPPGQWISGLVVHATSGTAKIVRPGLIESARDWLFAKYQDTTERSVSWTCTIDLDGSILQHADSSWTCFHACQVNPWTDSVELVQGPHGELTQVQIDAFVRFMDVWTREVGLIRATPFRDGRPYPGMLSRCLNAQGSGRALCGIYGHRAVWHADKASDRLIPYRGYGDPGDAPFLALAEAGYKQLDFERGDDLELWKQIQSDNGLEPDGIPGPKTRRLLYERGGTGAALLVSRPGDDTDGTPAWLEVTR